MPGASTTDAPGIFLFPPLLRGGLERGNVENRTTLNLRVYAAEAQSEGAIGCCDHPVRGFRRAGLPRFDGEGVAFDFVP